MYMCKSLLFCTIFLISSCKPTSRLLVFYGTQDNFLINNNKEKSIGDLTYCVGDYKFIIFYSDLKESVNEINKDHFYSPLDLKLPDRIITSLQESKDYLIVNKTDTLKYPEKHDYEPFLDFLFKQGKMYFEKLGSPLIHLEYIHWQPQYQGPVYSRWIDNEYIIKEITWALVD
jgi:hypothetical protein